MTSLVNLFCIGVKHGATTWLHFCLQNHPDIHMSVKKEFSYFCRDDLKYKTYIRYFKTGRKVKYKGESSVDYLYKANISAKNIFDYNPSSKIIAILRNPVDRAISNYKSLFKKTTQNKRYKKAIKRITNFEVTDKNLLEVFNNDVDGIRTRGHYKEQLEYFSKLFENNLLIFKYEWITQNHKAFFEKLYNSLEIPYYKPKYLNKQYLRTTHKKYKLGLKIKNRTEISENDREYIQKYYENSSSWQLWSELR